MPSSILYTLSLPIHLQILEEKRKRSESTNSSPETQDMSQISFLTEILLLLILRFIQFQLEKERDLCWKNKVEDYRRPDPQDFQEFQVTTRA